MKNKTIIAIIAMYIVILSTFSVIAYNNNNGFKTFSYNINNEDIETVANSLGYDKVQCTGRFNCKKTTLTQEEFIDMKLNNYIQNKANSYKSQKVINEAIEEAKKTIVTPITITKNGVSE